MSGIAGIIRFDGTVAPAEIEAMLLPMARRGPDRRQTLCHGKAGFGQALLATTAEAVAERQPWMHSDSGCIVVSDSRLDNRPELVRALGLESRPVDSIGDGELLHAAYQRWGGACAEKLLGDFAFAIWDVRRQTLFCARDIMGVRPLYFHHVPGRAFAFASDTESLLALPDVPRRINEGRIADALMQVLEGIDYTSTFYLDIERLPPARTLSVDHVRAMQSTYWQPIDERPADLPKSDNEWAAAIRAELEQAVRCRLRGTGRVGAMVSGGLDSSSVAALGQRILEAGQRGRLPTFSAINSHNECAETAAVRAMLAAFDFDATTVDLQDVGDLIPVVHAHLDQMREPFDGTMTLISAVYAAAAAAGVRSMLDGIPADNLYTAGEHFRQLAMAGHWRSLWREARALHTISLVRFPGLRAWQTLVGAMAPRALRKPWEARQDRAHFKALQKDSYIAPALAERVSLHQRFRSYRRNMAQTRLGNPTGTPHTIMTAAYITAGVERYNRVANFHGIEPRHPFLDRRIIELHAWLPLSLRLREGRYKWALRTAVQSLLPADVAWRKGKEHLGYRFNNRTLQDWAPSCGGPPGVTASILDMTSYRLNKARRPGEGARIEAWSPVLVAAWLQQQTASVDKGTPQTPILERAW